MDSAGNPLLITDPSGREIGYNPIDGNVVQQIPNSEYSAQALTDVEDLHSQAQTDYFIDLHSPMSGTYRLLVIGDQGSSSYDVTMITFAIDGSRQSTEELRGNITGGGDLLFQINFDPSTEESSTIDLIK